MAHLGRFIPKENIANKGDRDLWSKMAHRRWFGIGELPL
jgi:hypothetical protein